ncbi:MAG TPA: ABC transporter substrate-binding protein [Candidatus Dormibacteraeota bacterium]|nr:ABC transporter substrate-binding protein [Candidatus Dormibacteraeota bacterium]
MQTRRHVRWGRGVALGLGLVMALVIGGCSSTPASGSPSPASADLAAVTLRVGDQERRLETMMRASGQLDHLPYRVQWAEFTSGPPLLQALSGGALDLGSVGDTPPIFSEAAGGAGAQIRIVAASTTHGDRDAILVPAGSDIRSVAQLKGRKVAVAQGSSAHLTLLLALRQAGLSWGQIDPIYLQPPAAQSAFASHQIDAWAVWYPFVAAALSAGGRILLSGVQLDPGYSFLVSSVTSLQRRATSAAISDFLHRSALARAWANAHVTQWAALYARVSGLSPAESLQTERNSVATYVPVDDTVRRAEQAAADAFTDAGLLPRVDVARILDGRFNRSVVQS